MCGDVASVVREPTMTRGGRWCGARLAEEERGEEGGEDELQREEGRHQRRRAVHVAPRLPRATCITAGRVCHPLWLGVACAP